jgi:hypothetical protein
MSPCLNGGPLACSSRLSHQSPLAIHYAKCPPRREFSRQAGAAVITEALAVVDSSLQRGFHARVPATRESANRSVPAVGDGNKPRGRSEVVCKFQHVTVMIIPEFAGEGSHDFDPPSTPTEDCLSVIANRRQMASVSNEQAYENVLHWVDTLELVYDHVGNALSE